MKELSQSVPFDSSYTRIIIAFLGMDNNGILEISARFVQDFISCQKVHFVKIMIGRCKMNNPNKKYDVFISHASKDKSKYVNNLYMALKQECIKCFYDTECIGFGDSNTKVLEDALDDCYLAVIVVSKNYFNRKWTERELYMLLRRQKLEKRKIILPILYRVTKKEFTLQYPELSDIQFKYAKSCSCEEMARCIRKEVEKIRDNNR